MDSLPQDWSALSLLIFALGLKHGFDADHLATIDGLTRYNARNRPRLARYCGTLFSLGHGLVVLAIAAAVNLLAGRWAVPEWLEAFGTCTSVFFLTLLGVLNLRAVLRADPDQPVALVGVKGRFLGSWQRAGRPGLILLVGALFALSFDTLSQAALFGLTARHYGGWQPALGLALVFTAGMLAADGLNGYCIAQMIGRADRLARIASRLMSLTLAGLSLAIAALIVAKTLLPDLDALLEKEELLPGLAVVAVSCTAFLAALLLAQWRAVKSA
ncbi:nickel transporter [Methylococcus sp. EFPC2]|uniref:HoxN/HupN/NixA family nickel/cobalt transporter n=1 Tax=Methylococcus sp. EFPC2 TaxID=2812648 RepID=UPI0019688FEE|nr:nickel transporter [Methylococcus sp. EFPC2]QSA97321.1 nickel transporter [Methylococcus sp. EFPC2]